MAERTAHDLPGVVLHGRPSGEHSSHNPSPDALLGQPGSATMGLKRGSRLPNMEVLIAKDSTRSRGQLRCAPGLSGAYRLAAD